MPIYYDLVGLFLFLVMSHFEELLTALFSVSSFKANVLKKEPSHMTSTANHKEGNVDLKQV